jgi:hypothetical protein
MSVLALVTVLSACASAAQPSAGGGNAVYTGGEPNWRAAPTYGTIDLNAGFSPDPYLRSISAGGANEVGLGGSECTGYIHAAAPDLDLNYHNAGQYQLAIYAKADTDVTLIVNGPDGRYTTAGVGALHLGDGAALVGRTGPRGRGREPAG